MADPAPPGATVARALLASLFRHTLTMAGAALVTRGLVDQGTVDGYMATAVEMIVGGLMAGGALLWGQARAYLSHTRWKRAWDALTTVPAESPPASASGPNDINEEARWERQDHTAGCG